MPGKIQANGMSHNLHKSFQASARLGPIWIETANEGTFSSPEYYEIFQEHRNGLDLVFLGILFLFASSSISRRWAVHRRKYDIMAKSSSAKRKRGYL